MEREYTESSNHMKYKCSNIMNAHFQNMMRRYNKTRSPHKYSIQQ